jgi:hypothetical protein
LLLSRQGGGANTGKDEGECNCPQDGAHQGLHKVGRLNRFLTPIA